MRKFKIFILIIGTLINLNCSSKDDCTKTITIPQLYFVGNQSYSYDIKQEVPCDLPEPTDAKIIEPPLLENFNYEVLSFVYTPDTGNNTSKLEFEIKINNPNNYLVNGVPILTIISDGLQFSGSYSNNASVPCYEISANSSCTLTYEGEESLDLGIINSIKLVDVKYYLTN